MSKAVNHVNTLDHQTLPSMNTRIISGSAGSLLTALAVSPLDVVKVRQQASSSTRCNSCGTLLFHNGLMDCVVSKDVVKSIAKQKVVNERGTWRLLSHIFATEGFRGIYAGLAPTLAMSIPSTVLYFAAYDEIVARWRIANLNEQGNIDRLLIPLVGGASARTLATTITFPLELMRTRRALGYDSRSLFTQFFEVIKNEGGSSLYRGLGVTLLRDTPFSALYFLGLEHFKRTFARMPCLGGTDNGYVESPVTLTTHNFFSGMISGMIAAVFTTPFDVVKTRRQLSFSAVQPTSHCYHNGSLRTVTNSNASIVGEMSEIFKAEGIRGLWRGNNTRMMKIAPACGIMISCYELGKQMLR